MATGALAFLALTTTPSMGPSSAELTRPASAAESAAETRPGAASARTAAATNEKDLVRIGDSSLACTGRPRPACAGRAAILASERAVRCRSARRLLLHPDAARPDQRGPPARVLVQEAREFLRGEVRRLGA